MSIRNRPYLGGFLLNKTLVKHTPDTLVYINGMTEFATCTSCTKLLDFNKYITQVSCDASTEPNATGNVTLTVPPHELERFRHNGNYVLQPGLEVTIFMRGYFPMRDFGGFGQEVEFDEFDPNGVPMYPYYQVFRGVVVNTTHDFSGGFYTASLSCQNLLYFWQNLHLSVNGAVFGPKSAGMGVDPSLIGHSFTKINPYAIIYTLVKVGFGAAYGVDFQLSRAQNINARTDNHDTSMYQHMAEWWEKRWTENSGALRMYGIDGSMFNNAQQAYLGAWSDNTSKGFKARMSNLHQTLVRSTDFNPDSTAAAKIIARKTLFSQVMTKATLVVDDTKTGRSVSVVDDVVKMQAFVFDIGKLGHVNMFETEYMSKLQIAQAVTEITGFEFYQDVDGDLVFKPPMYNLDTRDDPVYRIKDRDLISVSETESEPQATMIKASGSHFANMAGHGVEGWMGVGAVYVDYRLVAKFGYKEESIETNYLNNRYQIYITAINRLDIANVGVKSAQITIPIRPELRPGYPVYIETLDSFFYAQSISHSFAPGSDCTTTIQGVAKRSRWFPPIKGPTEGVNVIGNMDLGGAGKHPSRPLMVYPEDIEGGEDENQGPPRMVGLPNVVMALDSSDIDPASYGVALPLTPEQCVRKSLLSGFLHAHPGVLGSETKYSISDGTRDPPRFTKEEIVSVFNSINEALDAGGSLPEPDQNNKLSALLIAVLQQFDPDIEEAEALQNWLYIQTSLKAKFAPGAALTGRYRYYSCSAPNPEDQSPNNTIFDVKDKKIKVKEVAPGSSTLPVFRYSEVDGRTIIKKGTPDRFFEIKALTGGKVSPEGSTVRVTTKSVSTAEIFYVTFMTHTRTANYTLSAVTGKPANRGRDFRINGENFEKIVVDRLLKNADTDSDENVGDRFSDIAKTLVDAINTWISAVKSKGGTVGDDVDGALAEFQKITTVSHTTTEINSNRPDQNMMAALAVSFGPQYKTAAVKVGAAGAKAITAGNYEELMESRAVFLEAVAGSGVDVPGGSPAKVTVGTQFEDDTTLYSPVFPVSDGEGFSLVGSMPYGRGITVSKYASLLDSSRQVEDTGDVAADSETARKAIDGHSVLMGNMDAIQEFYVSVFAVSGNNPTGNLTALAEVIGLSPSAQAAAAASLGSNSLEGLTVANAVQIISHSDDKSSQAFIRNSPVTSFFRGQSITESVAVSGLAGLEPENNAVCVCKGAEQDYFLMAFSQEYVALYGTEDAVEGFESEEIYYKGEQWKQSRDAMSGEVLDSRNSNLAERFTRSNVENRISSGVAGLSQSITQAAEGDLGLEET